MTTRRASQSMVIGVSALLFAAACGGTADPGPDPSSNAGSGGAVPSPIAGSGSGGKADASVIAGSGGMSAVVPMGGKGGSGTGGVSGGGSGGSSTGGTGGMEPVAGMSGTGGQAPVVETIPTLYWLDITANRVMRTQDFSTGDTLVTGTGTAPDGVAVDVAGGKVYWTNMGNLLGLGGGTLQRANLDGSGVETIVPAGVAQTPKQMTIDLSGQKIYWGDREGAKLWRADMDGQNPVAIVSAHGLSEVVGVTLDVPRGKVYFTDRTGKKILRTNIEMPAGKTGADRDDVEELFVLTGNASPIDLDIDHQNDLLYWTDRQLGTVNRAGLEIPSGATAANRTDAKAIVSGLTEPIGLSLDIENDKMYFGELGGQVYEAALDGSGKKAIVRSSGATGIAIAHLPKP